MSEKFNLQDRFLNHLRTHKIGIKVYLVNGFQLQGKVKSFDAYTILLEDGKKQSFVFKHAVSTIMPDSYVKLEKPTDESSSGLGD